MHECVLVMIPWLLFFLQSLGADLVAVETAEENNFIKNVIDVSDRNMPNAASYWVLGAKRRGSAREFFWVQTGSAVVFADWALGKPSYHSNGYIYMQGTLGRRKWGDHTCCVRSIICEASLGNYSLQ